jgi:cation transport regulator ChaB
MQGLKILLDLPEEIKEQIINDFGSVGNLYRKVFDLNQEEYKLTGGENGAS